MVGDINHIVIIESLSTGEKLTGTELYNDVIRRYIEFHNSKIQHKFHGVNTKEGLIELLHYYQVNSPYMIGGILLHLEMHGDENLTGLVLSNGELITWEGLIVLFRPININTCNQLYVSMATCNGRYLYKGVHPYDKSPYSCFISASEEVSPEEIIDQFTVLFERLIENGNLVKSYLEMEKLGTKFYYKDSETTFEEVFKMTAKQHLKDPGIKKEILEEMKTQLEGLELIDDDSYDYITKAALKDIYNKHKQAFNFKC